MKMIITNDDGIEAPGIAALHQVALELGLEPIVVAPTTEHSYGSHRVTTQTAIRVMEIKPNFFSVDGTPADCARLAIKNFAPEAKWIFSGINNGGNLGADIYTSGTIAAAREGALFGRQAIAISQLRMRGTEVDWSTSAIRAKKAIAALLQQETKVGSFWNVNLPFLGNSEMDPEIVFCPLDPNPLHVEYRKEGSGYLFAGDYHSRSRLTGHDFAECLSGKITVTAVPLQLPHSA